MKGVGFDRTLLEYDMDTNLWKAEFYHFMDEDDTFDITGWAPEEGGFLESRRKIAELLDSFDEEDKKL